MKKIPSKRNWIVELALIIVALAIIWILKSLLSRSAFLITCFFVFLITLMISISAWVSKKLEHFHILAALTAVSFIAATMLIYMAKDYTFISAENPFFAVSLVVALVIGLGVTATVYRFMRIPAEVEERERKRDKKNSKGAMLFILLIIMLLASVFSYQTVESVIEHSNYIFDEGKPEVVSATILEKDRINRRKGRDYYLFTVEIEGKTVELDVPSDDYYDYNVGDTYTFDRYEGGLGEPFYLPEA